MAIILEVNKMNSQLKILIKSFSGYVTEVLPDVAWVWFPCVEYAKDFTYAVRDVVYAERCGCSVKLEHYNK